MNKSDMAVLQAKQSKIVDPDILEIKNTNRAEHFSADKATYQTAIKAFLEKIR